MAEQYSAGDVLARLQLDISQWVRGLQDAQRQAEQFQQRFGQQRLPDLQLNTQVFTQNLRQLEQAHQQTTQRITQSEEQAAQRRRQIREQEGQEAIRQWQQGAASAQNAAMEALFRQPPRPSVPLLPVPSPGAQPAAGPGAVPGAVPSLQPLLQAMGQVTGAVPGLGQVTQAVSTLGQEFATLGTTTAASAMSMSGLLGIMGSVGIAAVSLGAATFALTKQFTDNRLALRDMHLETGLTLPQLQALTDQARRGNIEFGNLGTMLIRFNANIAQAQRDPNSQPGQMVFGSLRMTRQDLQDPFTALLTVAQRIQQLDPSNQGLVIRALFGRSPAEVFRLFNQLTGENLAVFRQRLAELERQGPAAFDATTQKAQEFQNRIAELETRVSERWRKIMETFGLPISNVLLNWLDGLGKELEADIHLITLLVAAFQALRGVTPGVGLPAAMQTGEMPAGVPREQQPLFARAAEQSHVPLALLLQVAGRESGFEAQALGPMTRSGQQARGVMQIMPSTAAARGFPVPEALFRPGVNIPLGAHLLSEELQHFQEYGAEGARLAVMAYNAGRTAVEHAIDQVRQRGQALTAGNVQALLPAETQTYVRDIFQGRAGLPYPQGLTGAGAPLAAASAAVPAETQALTANTAATQDNTKAKHDNAQAGAQVRTEEQRVAIERERDMLKSEAEALELLVIQRRADIIARQQDSVEAEKFQRAETQALRERQLAEQQRIGYPGGLPIDPGAQRDVYRRRVQQLGAQALAGAEEQQALQAHEAVVQARLRVDAAEAAEEQRARDAVVAARVRADAAEEKAATEAADAVVRSRVRSEAAEDSYLQKLKDTSEELAAQQQAIEALRAHPGADVQVLRLQRGLAGVTDVDKRAEAEQTLGTIAAQNQAIRRAQDMVQLSRRVGTEIEQIFSDVWSNVFDLAEGKGQDFGKNLVSSLQRFFRQFTLDLMNTQLNAFTGASAQTGGWSAQIGASIMKLFTGGPPQPAAGGGLFTSPTHVLVGEAGPELVLPLRGMQEGGVIDDLGDVATDEEARAAVQAIRTRLGRRQRFGALGGAAGTGLGGALAALLPAPDLQKAQAAYASAFRTWTDPASGELIMGAVDASNSILWASKVPGAAGYLAEPGPEGTGRQAGRAVLALLGSLAGAYAGSQLGRRTAQAGAVLHGPTMVLAGEAGAEAIIPLRQGGIPVSLAAGGRLVSRLPSGLEVPVLPMPRMQEGGMVVNQPGWLGVTGGPLGGPGSRYGGVTPVVHMTINTPDASSFRASQASIMLSAGQQLMRAMQRNG